MPEIRSPSQNAGVFSTTPENIVGDASALPDASWIVRKEGTSRHHADYATCGLREGLLEQVGHLFPGAGVCLGVVACEVGASQPIRLFIGEAVHNPAIDGDLPIHAALAQHFAEGFA